MEVDGLKALMENAESTQKAGLEFTSGKIFGKDVVLLECGVGKVNAAVGTQAMIDLLVPERKADCHSRRQGDLRQAG